MWNKSNYAHGQWIVDEINDFLIGMKSPWIYDIIIISQEDRKMAEMTREKELGLRCKRFREAKGWSQQKLADEIFTSKQHISNFEKNGIENDTWETSLCV